MNTFKVEAEIPRDLENKYRTTKHFMERLKYRTDPSPSKEIVHEVAENGTFKTTHISDRRIIEKVIDNVKWWLIIEVNPDAFFEEKKYHALVSIYAPNEHPEKHKTVFEADIE